MKKNIRTILKVIISAGGTGGHIFPALAVADRLKEVYPNIEILFVGAHGKMEMETVPKYGYQIVGLNIQGYNRIHFFKNIFLPFKIFKSFWQCRKILKTHRPNIVIGFGGYASFVVLRLAQFLNIPTAIHEQNSVVGKVNKILSKRANKIFVAYQSAQDTLPKTKVVFTGNPVRKDILLTSQINSKQALHFFNIKNTNNKTVLIVGGSLGSVSINEAIYKHLDYFITNNVNLIWQCGRAFDKYDEVKAMSCKHISINQFIEDMPKAYASADVIVSRAGALSVSELAIVGKPVIFVPYPFATEDHQTINAQNYVLHNAANMVKNEKVEMLLVPLINRILNNKYLRQTYSINIKKMATPNATALIVTEVLNIIKRKDFSTLPKSVFFIGIGGIGMSALARYCLKQKMKVSGYDKNTNEETKALKNMGIAVYDDQTDFNLLPQNIECVVYTPAVPFTTPIFQFYINRNIDILKRSQFLGLITKKNFNVCVCGTHGKTTVSSLMSYVLHRSIGCNAFLGGIALNFNSNLVLSTKSLVSVIEADEYDKSFLQLSPKVIIVTAMDADHLEIYNDKLGMVEHYFKFFDKLPKDGLLIVNYNLTLLYDFSKYNVISYSDENENANFYAKNVHIKNDNISYEVYHHKKHIGHFELNHLALFNVLNSLPVIIASLFLEVDITEVQHSLSRFKGIKRRFQIIVKNKKTVYVDDYAHHPEELKKSIESARALFKNKKITFVFQPHLFSRTKDFADDFAKVLESVDELILLPIYPAREKPIARITSQWLANKINNNTILLNKQDTLTYLKNNRRHIEVLMTVGAGDIDELVDDIKQMVLAN